MQLLESRVTLEKGNSACYFSLSLGAFNKNVNKKRWVGRRVGEDSATFWDKETEVPSLSQDKGTKRQAENLACQNPEQDAGRDDVTGQSLFSLYSPVLEHLFWFKNILFLF